MFRFGPFALERLLGRGGMAEAFLAVRHDEPALPVVLKRIRPDFAESEAHMRRFVLEAQVASRLRHPNLVRFREFGRVGSCHYIAMDHVRGHSLHRVLERSFALGRRFPAEAALHVGSGLLAGLSAMHGVHDDDGRPRPMLHRDLTPSNVIVAREGDPVIIDFGIAKDVNGPSITLPGQVIGTARYMAPEHRRCEYIDPRADVFSASVVLFELLVGRHPWPPLKGMKELLRTTFDPPEVPEEVRRDLSEEVLGVVTKGLRCRADERWADAEEMGRALRDAARGRSSPERGRVAVRAFVASLDLPFDEALSGPVIDLLPPLGDDEVVMWSSSGELARGAAPPSADEVLTARTAVLPVPPLPPRRDAGLDLSRAEAEALGRGVGARSAAVAIALVIVGAAGAGWALHLF